MKMKFLITLIILAGNAWNMTFAQCPVIPLPVSCHKEAGQLDLNQLQQIVVTDQRMEPAARYLQKELLRYKGLTVSQVAAEGAGLGAIIIGSDNNLPDEGYALNIASGRVRITAADPHGAFNGAVTLLQLIRLSKNNMVSCWQIKDHPAMKWRGVMLDESRHFFGVKTVKQLLDWMAFYKLDRLHLHLTDAPGWRIQIRKYPRLALVGGIGNYTDSLAPAAFLTQDDIDELVRYAKERFITIVPEIDMPGHAAAANRAYPEFSGGGSAKHPDFTFNPGKKGTYTYLTDILKEVNVLFPSKLIHIGGDEVGFGSEHWTSYPDVQQLMKTEHLKDEKAIEAYFTQRMADSIISLGAKVLGWDEISNANIPRQSAIIFWWRQDKPQTLKRSLDKGYDVVLCPRIPLYFDFVQSDRDISGRRWHHEFSSLEKIYHYSVEQYPDIITSQNRQLVLGIQANLWTEKISSVQRLEYMLFPRITALSEAAWTIPGKRNDYKGFTRRVALQEPLYQKENVKFYNVLHPDKSPEIIDQVIK